MDLPKYHISHTVFPDSSGNSAKGLRANQVPPQNVVMRLAQREMWGGHGKRVGTEKYLFQRGLYQSIYPNFTVTHVDKPPCFLRKFTPDGKYFVAFSADQMSVELYQFLGPEAANSLFVEVGEKWARHLDNSCNPPPAKKARSDQKKSHHGRGPEYKNKPSDPFNRGFTDNISSDDKDDYSQEIRRRIFDSLFRLKYKIRVAPQGEDLNRECSLFTEDLRYLIVGSATYFIDDEYHTSNPEQDFRNNESVQTNPRFMLEDYSIHIVDMYHGALSDTRTFKSDKIFLSHNQGLYLYKNTFAVLSVQHQTISLFAIDNGEFIPLRTIGRFCFEDDELLYSSVPNYANACPKDEKFYTSLKQRLLSHIFKRAQAAAKGTSTTPSDLSDMARFYQYYEQIAKLKIWKMQLLDEDHLLLKYSSEEVVTLKSAEPNSQHCLFVIYNISTTDILAVFENTTEPLVDFFENFTDYFRNNHLTLEARYTSSPSNNIYARQMQQKYRHTITSARFGGPVEATKRILSQLPISAQSYSASPYLDQALFSFDDHRVSSMERPKACGENPIRFYGRDSGIYKFQIHAGILTKGSAPSGRRLVAFTFHPTAPFAISVQRANAEYLVHFHLRVDPHSMLPLY